MHLVPGVNAWAREKPWNKIGKQYSAFFIRLSLPDVATLSDRRGNDPLHVAGVAAVC